MTDLVTSWEVEARGGGAMTFAESQQEYKVLEGRGPACHTHHVSPAPNVNPDAQETLTVC